MKCVERASKAMFSTVPPTTSGSQNYRKSQKLEKTVGDRKISEYKF